MEKCKQEMATAKALRSAIHKIVDCSPGDTGHEPDRLTAHMSALRLEKTDAETKVATFKNQRAGLIQAFPSKVKVQAIGTAPQVQLKLLQVKHIKLLELAKTAANGAQHLLKENKNLILKLTSAFRDHAVTLNECKTFECALKDWQAATIKFKRTMTTCSSALTTSAPPPPPSGLLTTAR